ncbi:hypothetical protein COMA2_170023 [Candidatus Nitrospira nitrificans]|uniref:Uncharacterized protein n=1 Tax=Candidatus Nitrospira nitrificans TaxID=1742973 RepID=A0A0S4LD16_9BACT|nr:hypothetical protein COMA2_170023 [Candidatus Nitrospira nitrificans]
MPDYKHRTIKLAPKKQGDETWGCAYRIIETSSSGWRFHKGYSYGSFGSRQEAATAALVEAKRIVDALEPLTHRPWPKPSAVLRNYENRIRRFLAWS